MKYEGWEKENLDALFRKVGGLEFELEDIGIVAGGVDAWRVEGIGGGSRRCRAWHNGWCEGGFSGRSTESLLFFEHQYSGAGDNYRFFCHSERRTCSFPSACIQKPVQLNHPH